MGTASLHTTIPVGQLYRAALGECQGHNLNVTLVAQNVLFLYHVMCSLGGSQVNLRAEETNESIGGGQCCAADENGDNIDTGGGKVVLQAGSSRRLTHRQLPLRCRLLPE